MIRYILSALILLILSTIIVSWRRHHKPRSKKPIQSDVQVQSDVRIKSDIRAGLKPALTTPSLTEVPPPAHANSFSSGIGIERNGLKPFRTEPLRAEPLRTENIIQDDELYIPIPLTISPSSQKTMPPQDSVSEVLSIVIEASKTKTFEGYNLLQTILATDLHYGEQRLFHKYKDANCTTILFSLAAGKEGKGFDLKDMRSLNCSELVLSMDTKATSEPKEVYNFMLAVAKQLSNNLGGKIIAQNMQGKL